jgi:hypothetical protein
MPAKHPDPEPDPILTGLVNDYLDALSGIDKHTKTKEQLAEQILQRLQPGQRFETQPGIGVRVQQPSRKWNEERARELLTDEQWKAIQFPRPSSQIAHSVLTGALFEACKVPEGKPSLRTL